jgi:hypothetical protein
MALEDGQVTVEVFMPETPFGGVQIERVAEVPVLVELNTGSPVRSVFGRVGDIMADCADYARCYSGFSPPVTFPGSWRVKSDGTFQFWNPDQSKWHTLLVHGGVGAEYLTIGAGEV